MNLPITITHQELLSLSPKVHTQIRDSTMMKRIPTTTTSSTLGSLEIVPEDDKTVFDVYQSFTLGCHDMDRVPPKGATIVLDPIKSYYNSLESGKSPNIDRLTVAKESTVIRSILALVNNSQKKECTVDPGCQVIAMSETTCHSLALAYDPEIRLNMESANGTFDWSLGLA